MKRGRKKGSTKAAIESRIARVAELLAQRQGSREIYGVCSDEFRVGHEVAQRYIDAAWDRVRERCNRSIEALRAQSIGALETAYRGAVADHKWAAAVAADDAIARRLGLNTEPSPEEAIAPSKIVVELIDVPRQDWSKWKPSEEAAKQAGDGREVR